MGNGVVAGKEQKNAGKLKMVITGASGFLGYALCAAARPHWSVHAVYRRNPPGTPGVTAVKLDLTDLGALPDFLTSVRPRVVIHAAADANVASCERNPEQSEVINVTVPTRLAGLCAQLGIQFVFTSSDLVFDGTQAPYDEMRAPTPFCVYSHQKARAEQAIRRICPGAIICRLPLMFGLAPSAAGNFFVQMLLAIDQGRPLDLFVDEYRTPVDTCSAARGVLMAVACEGQILHLGGRTRLSRFELGKMMARQMNVKPDMIRPIRLADFSSTVRRAPDCALDSRQTYALGYNPQPLPDAIRRIVAQFRNGWEDDIATQSKGLER